MGDPYWWLLGIHLTGVAIWVGANVALGVTAATWRGLRGRDGADQLFLGATHAISRVAWSALLVAVVAGAAYLQVGVPRSALSESTFDAWLGVKLALVALVVAAAGTHALVIGPRIRRLVDSGATAAQLEPLRRANLVLAMVATIGSVAILFAAAGLAGSI